MVRTRRPPILLIHPYFRFIVFVMPTSRANTLIKRMTAVSIGTSTAFHSLPESLFVLLNLASDPATQRRRLCASSRRALLNAVIRA